jgi:uncharacterized protein
MAEPTITPAADAHTARATVVTAAAPRYAKQLASHFGHKAEVRAEAEGSRIVLAVGSCLLVTGDNAIELRAEAETAEGLERVQKVIGSHLERFGQRDGLTVEWADRA